MTKSSFRVGHDAYQAQINMMKRHSTDTGSPEVQVTRLTQRIEHLNIHLRANKKDFSTKRGLMQLVAQRRKQLDYLHRDNPAAYERTLATLQLRK